MYLSAYSEQILANYLKGSDFPGAITSLTLALSSGDPLDDGSGLIEPTGTYARQPLLLSAPLSNETTGSVASNTTGLVFTGFTGTITHVAIFSNTGNMLFHGPLSAYRVISNPADTISFAITDVKISLTGLFSTYLSEIFINWTRGIMAPTAPASLILALSRADPLKNGTGIDPPLGGNNYAAQSIFFGALTSQNGIGTTFANNNALLFGPAQNSSWGTITYSAILDNAGNQYLQGSIAVPINISVGEGYGSAIGDISLIIR